MIRLIRRVARLFGSAGSRWADARDATDAYEQGDYEASLRVFLPMAEAGHVVAQLYLGLMYRNGQGVPANNAKALKWHLRAANQGNPNSQFAVGLMYADGLGVPQDNVQAYKWFALSSKVRLLGLREGGEARDWLAGKMSEEEIDAAEQLVHDFRPKTERMI